MARLDPHSHADLDQGRIVDLSWFIEVDFPRGLLHCRAILHFAESLGEFLDLDSRDLDIESIQDQAGTPVEWDLAEAEGFMGSRLRVFPVAPTTSLDIRYRSSPGASALQWLEPGLTAGKQRPFLFSQCQPIHARSILPCQDSPRVRFTYDAQVTVPEGMVAVMSAAPGARSEQPSGQVVWDFHMPQPIPSYLVALAVGDLVARDIGPRTRVYAEPATVEAAAWEFADAERMLEAAEALFGPYLWDRFDVLVMPPAFPYGGMENPRLTFLTPTLLAGDRSLVNVLAHELAHSWTGNLVTNATMNDFWLNEGFTVWAERRILERLEGADEAALAAAIGRHGLDGELARFGADSPFTALETDLAGIDPDEVYSLVPYEKGFLLVVLLERALGREAFDAFVKRYIAHFSFTSITTADFEAFLDAELPGLRERLDLDGWIHRPGLPSGAPEFSSAVLDELGALARATSDGRRLDPGQTTAWTATHWQIYLQQLPRPLPADELAWLDGQFGLTASGNAEILCEWLVIAATSGWEPAYGRLRSFLGRVGRMKYLKPLYKALMGDPATQALAREIFAASKDVYHPIARGGLRTLVEGQTPAV